MTISTSTPTTSGGDFTSIPILDYNLLRTDRAAFLAQLRHALIHVGFLYLRAPPVQTEAVIAQVPRFFGLPEESKARLGMVNSPHFLGYTATGTEYTKGQQDMREQFDFATPLESTWKLGDPDYLRLWGPSQWPTEAELPGFRAVMEKFLLDTDELAHMFTGLVSEAIGLGPDALYDFFEPPGMMQHRGKVRRSGDEEERELSSRCADDQVPRSAGGRFRSGGWSALRFRLPVVRTSYGVHSCITLTSADSLCKSPTTSPAFRCRTSRGTGSTHRGSRTPWLSTSERVSISPSRVHCETNAPRS